MQFSKTFVAVAALAASVFGAIDWTSDATIQCSKANWAQIKADADPLLPMAGALLTPEQKAKLDELLGGTNVFPVTPTDEFLRALPEAIPPSLLESTAGKYITPCLETAVTSSAAPTEEAPTEEAPTEEAPTEGGEESATEGGEETATEGGEEASSVPEGGEEVSSVPPKCKPRY
ncbi:hypothetical protein H4R20_007266 [Coemansia guatemalensis]|uniref:Uncharacterized protein n=1 Tax=Coemansia guatemalensis TaxID=2761395 RepID=A0A9W8HN13_9FUNG|nr:hypothetical protein H4R20_007266 [Coemansia guatemalensis]